ncbi:ATP-binding protein [Streptomyces sp. NBC_00576]|uniref:ATP-binding protein n=1 Tax=Streptomyces sp. NBC_00576 TaxID=2903665 RepID=UPI002E7FC45E|nr:ATP-binding protein [Streptomyces sp. NBC_00576]WUB71376.1 ATP-binding protein [Streptomyces sp. NBC_00576]
MTTAALAITCPLSNDLLPTAPPEPEKLAYSLTLPAAPTSAAIARAAARTVLRMHGLHDVTDAAVQVVSELTSCACRFTTADDIYVSLRYRDGALRVILYDAHPRHAHPRLSAACDARRRATLRVLACVVRACQGNWGFDAAREPGGGTRLWAVLPRSGARTYGVPGGGCE